ncbi:MAG: ribonuclease III [Gammaproteobacteria bacterium HGW-Gammaproteobacteria-4]|nr:MAG: ribonuclease III [Gammaproteobacteria bacterium HGW-Gammaproteobacteria-4]
MVPDTDPITGHRFSDPSLLEQALTHRSAGSQHNERQEFLGDALLNCIAAEALYRRWPRADEGALTRARAALVRESALADVARRLELGPRLTMGPGEMKSGGHRRDSVLADTVEAIIAAVYLDAGFVACRDMVLRWLEPDIAALPVGKVRKDAKTRLQEWLQGCSRPLPEYTLVDTRGAEHAKVFSVRCALADADLVALGEAGSRRRAEQEAAEAMLAQLEKRHE